MGTLNAQLFNRIPLVSKFRDAASQSQDWAKCRRGPYLLILAIPIISLYSLLSLIAGGFAAGRSLEQYERTGTAGPHASAFIILRLIAPIVELVHIPIHSRAFVRGKLPPGIACWATSIMASLWLVCLALFVVVLDLVDDTNGLGTSDDIGWGALNGMRAVLAGCMAILYVVYLGYACKAVIERRARGGTGADWAGRGGRPRSGSRQVTDTETAARELHVPRWVVRRPENTQRTWRAPEQDPPPPYTRYA